MNIPEAFDESNQAKAHVELDQEEFAELTSFLRSEMEREVEELNDTNMSDEQFVTALITEGLRLALRAFVGGRCYEEQYSTSDTFPIDLPKDVLGDVITILARRR